MLVKLIEVYNKKTYATNSNGKTEEFSHKWTYFSPVSRKFLVDRPTVR